MYQVRIGGLIFEGGGKKCTYTLAEFEGWFTGSSVRLAGTDRPTAHGAYSLPGYRGGRLITLTGQIHSLGGFDFERHVSALSSIGADGGTVTVTVQSEDGSWEASAQLAEEPDIRVLVYGQTAAYTLTLFASDPRKYGGTQEFTGSSVEVFHRGNFEAAPTVLVSGPRSAGYTVSSGGRSFVVSQGLGAGETHRIEMLTGQLYKNDVLVLGGASRMQTFTVPAGGKRVVSISSGSMTVRVRDTSI